MIILLILKWIGIVLAILLGIVLLLLLLALFYPFTYKIKVDNKDVSISVVYLLYLLSARASYIEGKFDANLKLAFYSLYPKKEKTDEKKKEKPLRQKSDRQTDKKENNVEKECEPRPVKDDKSPDIRPEGVHKLEDTDACKKSTSQGGKDNREAKSGDRKTGFRDKIDGYKRKVVKSLNSLADKADYLIRSYNNYTDAVANKTYTKLLKQTAVLLKHIRPRRGSLNFKVGFEDPSLTGTVLAIYSMVYPYYGKRLKLETDFENEVLQGHGKLCGHMMLIVPIIVFCRLYFDKNIKLFLDRR